MRVVETLGVFHGYHVHLLYGREAACIRIRPLGDENEEFTIATERWTELLRAIEAGETSTFGISVAAQDRAPTRFLYDEIRRTLRETDAGSRLQDMHLACISAILYHEGVLIHYSGVLGPAEHARMVLRRSKSRAT